MLVFKTIVSSSAIFKVPPGSKGTHTRLELGLWTPVECRFSLVGKGLFYGWAIPRNPCIDLEL